MASKKGTNQIQDSITFEEAFRELETVVHKLEEGKDSLSNSMKLYERGILLKQYCEEQLKEAQGKWEILKQKKDSPGTVEIEPLPRDIVQQSILPE